MVFPSAVLAVWVAVREGVGQPRMRGEKVKQALLACVWGSGVFSVLRVVPGGVEVSAENDYAFFDVSRDDIVLEVGPCLLSHCAVLWAWG